MHNSGWGLGLRCRISGLDAWAATRSGSNLSLRARWPRFPDSRVAGRAAGWRKTRPPARAPLDGQALGTTPNVSLKTVTLYVC
jgi:hypothetical protein